MGNFLRELFFLLYISLEFSCMENETQVEIERIGLSLLGKVLVFHGLAGTRIYFYPKVSAQRGVQWQKLPKREADHDDGTFFQLSLSHQYKSCVSLTLWQFCTLLLTNKTPVIALSHVCTQSEKRVPSSSYIYHSVSDFITLIITYQRKGKLYQAKQKGV